MSGDPSHSPNHVDRIVEQWAAARPDLDTRPMAVIGRLHRLADELRERLFTVYQRFDLSEGEFDLLATLRRSGEPYELTPGSLATSTMVTSGAISKRLDRLEARGLVGRRASERDGRSRAVALTEQGRALIDEAVTAHYANEAQLIESVPEADRVALARILQAWSDVLDGTAT